MLSTSFERPPGDIGHPDTFDFPTIREVVDGATVARVVGGQARGMVDAFVAAGHRLVGRGAAAITSSCGFLALHQRRIAAALPVPVAVSSLMQLRWVSATLGGGQGVGVITADAASLTPAHLRGAGAPIDVPVAGMPATGAFARAILHEQVALDRRAVEAELIEVARALVADHPKIGALLLECTNLPPYRAALRDAIGLPVYDICTLARWLWQGACARGH